MADNESTVTLLDQPMDDEGWSAEQVTLRLTAGGALTLRADAGGQAVQMQLGEHVSRYRREWTVTDVDAVVGALPAGVLLEQLRALLDVDADDEGTTIADRFLSWLDRNGIGYVGTERTD